MNDAFRELDHLCAKVADGLASEEDVQALDVLLGSSEAARRRYLSWMSLHGRLQERAIAATPIPSLMTLPRVVIPDTLYQRRWHSVAKIAAAFVAGGLGMLAFDRGMPHSAQSVVEPARSSLPTIAQVVARKDARWMVDGREPASRSDIRPGELHLTEGELTLAYPSGVELTLQAPLRAQLKDAQHVFVSDGELAARVPESVAGFVVEMPGAALLDLGTSFSVKVPSSGPASMLVREGSVMATLLDDQGASSLEYLAIEGDVVTIDTSSRILEKRAEAGEFLAPRDLPRNPLPLGPEYAVAVKASTPRVWWRFDEPEGQPVVNEAGPGFSLHPFGAPRREESGPLANAWAEFPGDVEAGFALPEALPDLNGGKGYTLELWLRTDYQVHATALGLLEAAAPWSELSAPPLFSEPAKVRQSYLSVIEIVGTPNSAAGLLHPAQRLRYLHRSPPSQATGTNIFSSAPYRLRRWHHLAAVHEGEEMRLYLDGRLAGRELIHPKPGAEMFHVIVGRQRPAGFTTDARPWIGALDEIALYNRPLDEAEIRAHYDAAPATHFKPTLAWQPSR